MHPKNFRIQINAYKYHADFVITCIDSPLDIENAINQIIRDTGIGVLLVEQHLHFVRQANRYYAMQRGGIVANGPTESLSREIVEKFLSV